MNTFEQVKALLADRLGVDAGTMTRESSFQDLNIDSLDLYEMMYEVEQKFGVEIPETETSNIDSVGKLVDFIDKAKK